MVVYNISGKSLVALNNSFPGSFGALKKDSLKLEPPLEAPVTGTGSNVFE